MWLSMSYTLLCGHLWVVRVCFLQTVLSPFVNLHTWNLYKLRYNLEQMWPHLLYLSLLLKQFQRACIRLTCWWMSENCMLGGQSDWICSHTRFQRIEHLPHQTRWCALFLSKTLNSSVPFHLRSSRPCFVQYKGVCLQFQFHQYWLPCLLHWSS